MFNGRIVAVADVELKLRCKGRNLCLALLAWRGVVKTLLAPLRKRAPHTLAADKKFRTSYTAHLQSNTSSHEFEKPLSFVTLLLIEEVVESLGPTARVSHNGRWSGGGVWIDFASHTQLLQEENQWSKVSGMADLPLILGVCSGGGLSDRRFVLIRGLS